MGSNLELYLPKVGQLVSQFKVLREKMEMQKGIQESN